MTKVTKPGLPRPDSSPRVESDDSAAWDALPDLPATLQAVIDAVPAMISAKDKDSRYLVMNRWQAELYGVTPAQAVGKTAADLINAEYGALTRDRDLQVLSSGEPLPYFEEEFLGLDNDQRTMLTTKAPLADGLGRVVGVVTASLDITKRKRTEAALRESEAKTKQAIMILTSAIESMNDGFVLFDGDDRLVMCNERYREYYPEVVDILVPWDLAGRAYQSLCGSGRALFPTRRARALYLGAPQSLEGRTFNGRADPRRPLDRNTRQGRRRRLLGWHTH